MESIAEDNYDDGHGSQASSIEVTTPRGTRRSISHRRVRSIVVGGAFELNKIKKEQEVEILHSELEKQNKALEVSQEETQLAARIGQSLLLQNQQLDYELESKVATLTQKSEEAEQNVKQLEQKLNDMNILHREMELNHSKILRENECLMYDLTQARSVIKPLKEELVRLKDELNSQQIHTLRTTSEANDIKMNSDELKSRFEQVAAENELLVVQLSELKDITQESDLHLSRMSSTLESTNQKYDDLQAQFDFLSEKHEETTQQLNDLTLQHQTLQEDASASTQQVATLSNELQYLTEQLEQERFAAQDLLLKHEELIESISNGNPSSMELTPSRGHTRQPSEFYISHPNGITRHSNDSTSSSFRHHRQSSSVDISGHGRKPSEFDCSTMLHQESMQEKRRAEVLKRGSLFHELSRELEKEFQRAKEKSLKEIERGDCINCSVLMEREAELTQQVASLTLELQHSKESTGRTSPVKPIRRVSGACTTCIEFMQREGVQNQLVASLTVEVEHLKTKLASIPEPLAEEDVLKEFFVLTSAALKVGGAGIKNDRCNISNEILYEKAMAEHISFDQFSNWIYNQLEDKN